MLEALVVVLVIVLIFGASRIPTLARSAGRARGEFEKGRTDFDPVRPDPDPPLEE